VQSFFRAFFCSLILALLGAGIASAQFNLLLTSNGSSATIPNNQAITINTPVNIQSQVTLTVTYTGTSSATVSSAPNTWLLGSTEFTLALTKGGPPPIVLSPGSSFTFTVTYNPTTPNPTSALVTIPYTEPGTNATPVQGAITLSFTGTSPSFTLSYILATDQNAISIPSGGTIPFGPTLINTTASANLDINNQGSGSGGITAITSPPTGSPFKLQNIPLLPYTLAAGTFLPLVVQYTPTAVQNDTAQITITYQGGATATVNLTGNGIASTFSYKYLIQGTATAIKPGGTIPFPGANLGSSSSLIVQVTNSGSATGTINSVSTQGPFTLTNPVTLPATVTTGNSFSVPLTFTPTQVGTQTGEVLIGNDFFVLSGQGLGPNLTYSYTSSAGTTPVNPATGGAVVFGSVAVGKSEQVTFTVTNSGSQATTISLIGTTPTGGPFSVSAPSLSLAPGQSGHFAITFAPTTTGVTSGDLVLNTTVIPLTGLGTAPPNLPSYTISGPSGTVSPASQEAVGLTLASPYPVDLTGVLTLTTSGNFGTDPAVQFQTGNSTGNRTVDFTIPANSTSADFNGQGSQILLQTGTVAETITLKPSFATAAGEDVTPSSPTTLQFTVDSLAPVLESAQVGNTTASSFTLQITGYSTTRDLSSLVVTFNPASGFHLATSQFTIDVSQVSKVWFQSSASLAFGGLFQITVPFNLTGSVPANDTLLDTIASVSATLSNSVGTSTSLQANVQ
jgi:Abnormal spindle-like microcephaly-assoc'd, ASPM-SPD-2-Hydin